MNGGSAILPTENVRELASVTKSIPEQRIAKRCGRYTPKCRFIIEAKPARNDKRLHNSAQRSLDAPQAHFEG